MTKLKTLKDIDVEPFCHGVSKRDLKSEAVKWVKAYPEFPLILECPEDETIDTSYKNIIRFIKHFFNITEADLQEKEE